jgi:hypothetical protein
MNIPKVIGVDFSKGAGFKVTSIGMDPAAGDAFDADRSNRGKSAPIISFHL